MCGEGPQRSSFARWPGPYAVADDVDANEPEGWEERIDHEGWERSEAAPWNRNQSDELEQQWDDSLYLDGLDDDDLPDFEFDEDDEDWDEEDWFEDEDDWINDPLLSLEDAIMLMDEDSLLEWLLEEETEFAWRRGDACGESAYLEDEAA